MANIPSQDTAALVLQLPTTRTQTLACLWFTKGTSKNGESIMYKIEGIPEDTAYAVIASMQLCGYRFVPLGSSSLSYCPGTQGV